jgi:hypothetical protein
LNNDLGVDLPYAQNTVLRNVSVINTSSSRPMSGISNNHVTLNITYDNVTVVNYHQGIDVPRRGNVLINGGTFIGNDYDFVIRSGAIADRSVLITGLATLPKILTIVDTYPIYGDSVAAFLHQDLVLLNFGPFLNQRLYNVMQHANAIPFPVQREDTPPGYVGLTNQQLWDQFGVAFGGAIAPGNAFTVPYIVGLIAPLV